MSRVKPGDIILYKSHGSLFDHLISFATGGPYVHCSIVLDLAHVIAANVSGIGSTLKPAIDDNHTLISMASYATPSGIQRGLFWALQQGGKEYGWTDVITQGLKFLWPNNPLRIGYRDRWDCSDYVSRYLMHAGVQMPDGFDDPYTLTPMDIARIFSLAHPRAGHSVEVVKVVDA